MKLIISMGIPSKNYNKMTEGFRFDGAKICILDWDKKTIEKEITYRSPVEHLPAGLSMMFKGATIEDQCCYVVTNTEVLRYGLDDWALQSVITHPTFNDLHGVLACDDSLYVCNTGLEIVQNFSKAGELIDEINMTHTPTWNRFDKGTDYRCIPTTKPHEVHINHVFLLDGELWVTRADKLDAVNAANHTDRIDVVAGMCHDGIVKDGWIYFSTVNGHIIVADSITKKIIQDIDVNFLVSPGRKLGWVRGLAILDKYALLGTSKTRASKFKEYAKWVISGPESIEMASSIFLIDMHEGKVIEVYELPDKEAAIYTILEHPYANRLKTRG